MLFTGIGLCGLCCALPFIGVAISAGSLSLAGYYIEKLGWALLLISILVFLYRFFRKSNPNSCNTDCSCSTSGKVENTKL